MSAIEALNNLTKKYNQLDKVVELHTVLFVIVVTLALGFTMIVKVIGVPLQFVLLENIGVTVTVAVTGDDPMFTALKAEIFPEPDAGNPIEVVLFVQLYVVVPPSLSVEKTISGREQPCKNPIT